MVDQHISGAFLVNPKKVSESPLKHHQEAGSVNIVEEASFCNRIRLNESSMMNDPDLISKIYKSNKLSKYLSKQIGKKDYRTTEERELAKCTFKPKLYPAGKRKTIKSKIA